MSANNLFKPSVRYTADLSAPLTVELRSDRLVYEMITEFGVTKTAAAIQALYDADVLNDDQANAMLNVLNEYEFGCLARFGYTHDGRDDHKLIQLH